METEPPPTKNKNGEASRSAIFDAYIQHFQSQSSRDSSKKKVCVDLSVSFSTSLYFFRPMCYFFSLNFVYFGI